MRNYNLRLHGKQNNCQKFIIRSFIINNRILGNTAEIIK